MRTKSTPKSRASRTVNPRGVPAPPAHKAPQFPQFAERVKRLLGEGSQQALAERLKVSQAQVSAWARGTEKPSAEALIRMANIASSVEERYFFWVSSGIDERRLEGTVLARIASTRSPWDPAAQVSVSIVESFRILEGRIAKGDTAGEINLPAVCFEHPTSLIGLRYENRLLELPRSGDLLVIDDFDVEPQSLREKMIAVHFSPFPVEPEHDQRYMLLRKKDGRVSYPEPRRIDHASANLQASREAEYLKRADPEMWAAQRELEESEQGLWLNAWTRPGVLAGWLKVEFASGESSMERRPKDDQWRLTLHLDGPNNPIGTFVPLTEWQSDVPDIQNDYSTPLSSRLREGIWIVGEVSAWIAASREQTGPARREEKA